RTYSRPTVFPDVLLPRYAPLRRLPRPAPVPRSPATTKPDPPRSTPCHACRAGTALRRFRLRAFGSGPTEAVAPCAGVLQPGRRYVLRPRPRSNGAGEGPWVYRNRMG